MNFSDFSFVNEKKNPDDGLLVVDKMHFEEITSSLCVSEIQFRRFKCFKCIFCESSDDHV